MKTLNFISRLIVGIVFIFSGFVKAVDPLGFGYKFSDYFHAFGMEFFSSISFSLAILMSALEFGIGFSLVLGTLRKFTSWLLMLFMGFFTTLTFILAIYNPVSDCGCFGDAITMTNWETFSKNVFLMIFTIIIFINRNKFEAKWNLYKQYVIAGIPVIFSVLLSIHCYRNLPIMDFRPYKVGTYIPEKMIVPDDAPRAEYETMLVYEKDGVQKEFSLQNLPDSTWKWVSTNNVLISEGYVPPIHDFTIQSLDGDDITDLILADNKFTFLLVAYDLKNTSLKNIDKVNTIANYAIQDGTINFLGLTASLPNEIDHFIEKSEAPYLFYNTDEITLKTIVRANPGLVLLKNGTILGKWHHKNIPTVKEFEEMFFKNPKYKKDKASQEEILALKIKN